MNCRTARITADDVKAAQYKLGKEFYGLRRCGARHANNEKPGEVDQDNASDAASVASSGEKPPTKSGRFTGLLSS
ncbi:hypothetical protein HDU82_004914 [Entophlyctis luteolus]|nr:hypothetical protein HDU82_004914 [Entophlyctis luteolus]